MSEERRAFIGMGSNLGDSKRILQLAFRRMYPLSREPVIRSSLWKSTPVDCPPGSPYFINAVVALTPHEAETPESLLLKLQAVEREFGRGPKQVLNEARPLDLDLITFGEEVRTSAELVLPHPRAHLRRFVLAPLAEVAPELVLPGQKKNVRELLAELRTDEVVERLTSTEEK